MLERRDGPILRRKLNMMVV